MLNPKMGFDEFRLVLLVIFVGMGNEVNES
jgi:hypothetical protein